MKIAAICAYPSNLNPGMLSVDLALDHVVGRLGAPVELVRYTIENALSLPAGETGIHYRHLQSPEELDAYDHIIFWGDFLHWLGYAQHDLLLREKKRHPHLSDAQILDRWYRLLLLEDQPARQERVLIFGSTIYGLSAHQLGNTRYREALGNLYRRARLVQMRDLYSAGFVQQLAPERPPAFGCDCALLMDSDRLVAPAPLHTSSGMALLAFGRSDGRLALQAFGHELAMASQRKPVNLTWFDRSGVQGLARKIALIRQADIVITDIYHLSVTALRERVPTLCIGRGGGWVQNTLSDKKKELFFAQAFAASNYFHTEDVHRVLQSDAETRLLVGRGVQALADQGANTLIFDSLAAQAERAGARLQAAIAG